MAQSCCDDLRRPASPPRVRIARSIPTFFAIVINMPFLICSESSMFVNKSRFILKTCGTTTPLHCVKPLLYLVDQFTTYDEVQDVYYSRKNYMKPELQKQPHSCFEEETKMLEKLFPGGAPYCVGRVDRDCWYLYTTNSLSFANPRGLTDGDQTLEVLMTNLDPQVMSVFTKEVCSTAQEATQLIGIDKFLPNVYIDDYLFDPCGYSMNGIMKTGHYMTIHITPESNCSYVSFETNYPMDSYHDLITRVVNAFNPGKFVVTAFVSKGPQEGRSQEFYEQRFGKYSCLDMQLCKFKNYDLTYALFAKFPS